MHRTAEELNAGLALIEAAPRDGGRVEAIVVRPGRDERRTMDRCRLEPEVGAVGDRWAQGYTMLPGMDSGERDTQLTLMNSRAAELIAGSRERWALAGDQLFVDLDLSTANLRPGDRLRVGDALIEVTAKPHDGCRKFAARYGAAALAFVNSGEGKRLHLRGVYARVVEAGEVRIGDRIEKHPLHVESGG